MKLAVAAAIAAGCALGFTSQGQAAGPLFYGLDDPAALAMNTSNADAVNSSGATAGCTYVGNDPCHPVRWDAGGAMTELPMAPGDVIGGVSGLNDDGLMVGSLGPGRIQSSRPVRWDADGNLSDLPLLPGYTVGSATKINSVGTAVGAISNSNGSSWLAVSWDADGNITRLPDLPGTVSVAANAYGINDDGIIVGYVFLDDRVTHKAVRWNPDGTMTELPGLRPDGTGGTAYGINADGVVAGLGYTTDKKFHAVRWSPDGSVTELPLLPGDEMAIVGGINRDGLIVGVTQYFETGGAMHRHPVTWAADGTITELPRFPGAKESGSAWGVNGAGQIVGDLTLADNSPVHHAVRWEPDGTIFDLDA